MTDAGLVIMAAVAAVIYLCACVRMHEHWGVLLGVVNGLRFVVSLSHLKTRSKLYHNHPNLSITVNAVFAVRTAVLAAVFRCIYTVAQKRLVELFGINGHPSVLATFWPKIVGLQRSHFGDWTPLKF